MVLKPDLCALSLSLTVGKTYWNGTDVAERSWFPSSVPVESKSAVEADLAKLEAHLNPAGNGWIGGRVMTLLAHYWTPEMPETLQAAVGLDWIQLLSPFPQWAIERACSEYLSASSRYKPVPGQIASLAREACGTEMKQRDRLSQCLRQRGDERANERGGVKSLGSITREEALAFSAKVKAELRAEA